jgi:NAD(P)-dependent dehydrogenase (short-subunit alcohol dehydrogenase family)
MTIRLLPLHEQVMVITGASSGIGLVTAKQGAARGARVVLAARNGRNLQQAVEEIRHRGGRAIHVVADVADRAQVDRIADAAHAEFGRIDTWVNNAAVSMYGRVTEISIDDMRRQMDVNYWGQVYGSITAVRHLRTRGGALVNVGSALCDRAIPLQANYCAAKHALKGFTDALRMELEEQGVPISVTLVKPASSDTPFFEKARIISVSNRSQFLQCTRRKSSRPSFSRRRSALYGN